MIANNEQKRITLGSIRTLVTRLTKVQTVHTSKINNLCSSLNSKEMLQNFLYLYKKKTQVVFFIFCFEQLLFLPYECPSLCRHSAKH